MKGNTPKVPDVKTEISSSPTPEQLPYFNMHRDSKITQNKLESSSTDTEHRLADVSKKIQDVEKIQNMIKGQNDLKRKIPSLEQNFKPFTSTFENFQRNKREVEQLLGSSILNNDRAILYQENGYENKIYHLGDHFFTEIKKRQRDFNSNQLDQIETRAKDAKLYANWAPFIRETLQQSIHLSHAPLERLRGIRDRYTTNITIPDQDTYGNIGNIDDDDIINRAIEYASHTSEHLTNIDDTNIKDKSSEAKQYNELSHNLGILTSKIKDNSANWEEKGWNLNEEEYEDATKSVHLIKLLDTIHSNQCKFIDSALRFTSNSVSRFLTDTWNLYKELPNVKNAIEKYALLTEAKQKLEKIDKEINDILQSTSAGIDLGNTTSPVKLGV